MCPKIRWDGWKIFWWGTKQGLKTCIATGHPSIHLMIFWRSHAQVHQVMMLMHHAWMKASRTSLWKFYIDGDWIDPCLTDNHRVGWVGQCDKNLKLPIEKNLSLGLFFPVPREIINKAYSPPLLLSPLGPTPQQWAVAMPARSSLETSFTSTRGRVRVVVLKARKRPCPIVCLITIYA